MKKKAVKKKAATKKAAPKKKKTAKKKKVVSAASDDPIVKPKKKKRAKKKAAPKKKPAAGFGDGLLEEAEAPEAPIEEPATVEEPIVAAAPVEEVAQEAPVADEAAASNTEGQATAADDADEYGRPKPVANYVVHVYELGRLKRTIDRDFTPEDAEAFATEFSRTAKHYGRKAVAGKKDTQPATTID